jgi:phenylpropionate dioxygenase-like ring-hydroxylating dioxygenase large terminal subunit
MYINFWYPIGLSEEVVSYEPFQTQVLGQKLVAFRDSEGAPHVLSDVCIHRGGSLGKGWVKGGSVVCPYHGWQFGGDGKCTHIPSLDVKSMPGRAKVDSYPVQEKYGVVFAFLGDLPEADRPPLTEVEEDGQAGWHTSGPLVFEVGAYYERSIENGMDPVHNEFVHPSQGAPAIDEERFQVSRDEWGSRFEVAFGGYTDEAARQKVSDATDTEGEGLRAGSWHVGPNTLVTGIHLPGNNSFIQYFYEAPLSNGRTRIFFVNARNNNLDPKQDEWINGTFINVANEDRAVIEELWPVRTPDSLTKELLTPGDAGVVGFRECLKDWDGRGWRIDWKTVEDRRGDVAYAIPSPARRESGNWVLDTIPLIEPS